MQRQRAAARKVLEVALVALGFMLRSLPGLMNASYSR